MARERSLICASVGEAAGACLKPRASNTADGFGLTTRYFKV